MSPIQDRLLLDKVKQEVAPAMAPKLEAMKGIVVALGSGAYDGMVRIRRDPHEPVDVGRPYYFCVGKVPVVGTPVWAMANHATGFVFGDFVDPEDIPDPGILEVADSGTARPRQPQINLGAGLTAVDNPGASRTDLSFQKSTAGISNQSVQKSGSARAERAALNLGAGFLATDNAGSNRTDIDLNPTEKLASPTVSGFMDSADKGKLNGVETGATADQTPTEIFNATKSLDGSGSTLDADLVDGVHASGLAPAAHVGASGLATHPAATPSVAGFLSAGDKQRLDNAPQLGGTAHPEPFAQTPLPNPTLAAGQFATWNTGFATTPRFIFAQVRESGSGVQWKPAAEGIAPGPSQFSLAVLNGDMNINNNEPGPIVYRVFLWE